MNISPCPWKTKQVSNYTTIITDADDAQITESRFAYPGDALLASKAPELLDALRKLHNKVGRDFFSYDQRNLFFDLKDINLDQPDKSKPVTIRCMHCHNTIAIIHPSPKARTIDISYCECQIPKGR